VSRAEVTAVITRGRTRDYGYLGTPGDEWWVEPARFTDLDQPAVLALRDGTGFRALVSGIPSARRDSVGRTIRLTLVLAGDDRPGAVLALARAALDDTARAALGARLDGVITEALVDEWRGVVDRPLGPAADAVLDAVGSPEEQVPGTGQPASWVMSADDPASTDTFLARLSDLLTGEAFGYAIATNRLVSEAGAERARQSLGVDTAVLLLSDSATVAGVRPLGKAPGTPRSPTPTPFPVRLLLGAGLALVVLLALLLL